MRLLQLLRPGCPLSTPTPAARCPLPCCHRPPGAPGAGARVRRLGAVGAVGCAALPGRGAAGLARPGRGAGLPALLPAAQRPCVAQAGEAGAAGAAGAAGPRRAGALPRQDACTVLRIGCCTGDGHTEAGALAQVQRPACGLTPHPACPGPPPPAGAAAAARQLGRRGCARGWRGAARGGRAGPGAAAAGAALRGGAGWRGPGQRAGRRRGARPGALQLAHSAVSACQRVAGCLCCSAPQAHTRCASGCRRWRCPCWRPSCAATPGSTRRRWCSWATASRSCRAAPRRAPRWPGCWASTRRCSRAARRCCRSWWRARGSSGCSRCSCRCSLRRPR
jgi:hypothetical protein